MTKIQEQAYIGIMSIEKGFANFSQLERAKNICLSYVEQQGLKFQNFQLSSNIQDNWHCLFNWVISREFEKSVYSEILK